MISKILLVDDNDINRDAFKTSLEREGFTVQAVENGPEGLKLLVSQAFDLVLLDIHMPGMNGYEVLAAIRKKYSAEDLPVIMETARDTSDDIIKGLELGANDYVTKPINFPVALARVRVQILHKRSIDLLRENETRLRQLDRMKNDFISMVTHELTTPITVIHGAVGCFEDKLFGPLNEKYESYVHMMAQNAEQLVRLAHDLLDLTKMSAGRFSIKKQRVDIRQIIASACQSLETIVEKRNIQIVFPGDTLPPLVADVDPQRMKQVVSNIVRNALRFSKNRLNIHLERDGSECRMVIEDDGPGIEPDDLPNIFEKFFQGKTQDGSEGGSGLGLAIVQGIVEGHGGRVTAENLVPARDGHTGARFVVTLPIPKSGGA